MNPSSPRPGAPDGSSDRPRADLCMTTIAIVWHFFDVFTGLWCPVSSTCDLHPDGTITGHPVNSRHGRRARLDSVKITGWEGDSQTPPCYAFRVPEGVTDLGRGVFRHVDCRLSVVLPSTITTIADGAFYGCPFLAEIVLPNGLEEIGEDAFIGCHGLSSLVVPQTVRRIEDYAFARCTGLTSITLPEEVDHFGTNLFEDCIRLRSVRLPRGPTTVGEYTFDHCFDLTSVTLPEGITRIEECVFSHCRGLFSVVLPRSCVEIGGWAFEGCSELSLVVGEPLFRVITYDHDIDDYVTGERLSIVASCPLMNKTHVVLPHTRATVNAAIRLEYWTPSVHMRCTPLQRDWAKFALLVLTRTVGLPHVPALLVLRQLRRHELCPA